MATAGVLFLAKVLADQGWHVEHEPDVSGVTPDFRIRKGEAGARVRMRLDALLPFEVPVTDRGFAVRARLLANPARPGVVGLEEFRPIPSLLHLEPGRLGYVGANGTPLGRDEQIVDAFVP